jgi:hypothetical protein
MLTENTIMLRTENFSVFDKVATNYVANDEIVFSNDEVTVIVFDCNGNPEEIEDKVPFLMLETNYLDGEPMHTRIFDEKNQIIKDVRYRGWYWIKKRIGDASYESIASDLMYSDGRK